MLKLINIKKDYGTSSQKVTALKGIDLDFKKSEFVSILGPSGCGKTTLLNIIGGLDQYTSGDLIIKEKSTKDFKEKDWDLYRNQSIGFVFQSYNLIQHLTILGNVELALTISGISKKERKARAMEALQQVELTEQAHKKPNQLSGGQMQRVAIARALVNNPEILLADEPTGALDTKTSLQIMALLQEISKDRLVIMVTHNPDIAKNYSTRIIRMLDGEITEDSKNMPVMEPIKKQKEKHEVIEKAKGKKIKTSMNFFTALSLSFKNLWSKKTRTILTAVAGSIGIIGIALVLALSNGFSHYIAKMQADTLSSYPLTISETSYDLSSISDFQFTENLEKYPTIEKIFINNLSKRLEGLTKRNTITQEYIDSTIKTLDKSLYNDIVYSTGLALNVYKKVTYGSNEIYTKLKTSESSSMMGLSSNDLWQPLLDNKEFMDSQFDLIAGTYAQSKNDLVLIVDKYNSLSDLTLAQLGIPTTENGEPLKEINFNELIGTEFKILINDNEYIYDSNNNKFASINPLVHDFSTEETLTITGILRPNKNTENAVISSGIGYSSQLYSFLLTKNKDSQIVEFTNKEENKDINPLTGTVYDNDPLAAINAKNKVLRQLGAINIPNSIKIYAKSFDTKEEIKTHLNNYNVDKEDKDKIFYTDMMALLVTTLNTMIDAIKYVLIAFTSISLLVSSIMIGIITYVSVIERTKEIGILRSIGARKKDISRVFNAETFIIGLTSGLFGVIVTFLLTIPINLLLNSLLSGIGNLASLDIVSALILTVISVLLTLISGFIPSRIASKKDPVEALRTE